MWCTDAKHLLPGSSDPSLRGHSPNNPGHLVNLENSWSIAIPTKIVILKQNLTAVETSQKGKSNQILFCSDTSGLQIETEEWFSFCKFNCRPGQFYSIWGNIRFCFCPPADILAPYFAVQMCCSRWKMICFVFCPCVLVCPWPHLQRVMMGSICFVFLICLCCVLICVLFCVLPACVGLSTPAESDDGVALQKVWW